VANGRLGGLTTSLSIDLCFLVCGSPRTVNGPVSSEGVAM
jgi:hypothetical protein